MRTLARFDLLPALPKAWPAGALRGLQARGGFEVDIAWQDGVLDAATIQSRAGAPPLSATGSMSSSSTSSPASESERFGVAPRCSKRVAEMALSETLAFKSLVERRLVEKAGLDCALTLTSMVSFKAPERRELP